MFPPPPSLSPPDPKQGVQYIHGEVASLLQLRNNLASHLMRTPEPHGPVPHLPPVLQDPQVSSSLGIRLPPPSRALSPLTLLSLSVLPPASCLPLPARSSHRRLRCSSPR